MLTIFKVRITSNKIRIYTVLITKKASFILKIMRWYVIYVGGTVYSDVAKWETVAVVKVGEI